MYNYYNRFKINLVLFGANEVSSNSSIDTEPINFEQSLLVEKFIKNKLPIEVTLQLNDENRLYVNDIIAYIKNKWAIDPMVSDVINIKANERLTHIRDGIKTISSYECREEFFFRQEYNTCLFGSFAIDINGNVTPCPEIDEHMGNMVNEDLISILSKDTLYDYWQFNKDNVENCKKCSMKYFCSDCSKFEIECNKNNKLHSVFCNINLDNKDSLINMDFNNNNFISKLEL